MNKYAFLVRKLSVCYSLWVQKVCQLTYTDACGNITGTRGYPKPQEFAVLANAMKFCRCVWLFTSTFRTFYCSQCTKTCLSPWPRDLTRGSAAARLLGLWLRIPLWCTDVPCEMLCVVQVETLRLADPSSRGLLPSVCVCVIECGRYSSTATLSSQI